MRRRGILAVLVGVFIFVPVAVAQADPFAELVININNRSATPEGMVAVKREIANIFGVSIKTIEYQQQLHRVGMGELTIAHALARASGRSVNDILAMRARKGGHGWGKIANDLGLKLGQVMSDLKRADQATAHLSPGGPKKLEGPSSGDGGPKKLDHPGPGNGGPPARGPRGKGRP